MSDASRIAAISARADVLFARISKAANKGPKRPRVPGDGDGDGIPNEGKKPGMSLSAAASKYPRAGRKIQSLADGKSLVVSANANNSEFHRLTRQGDSIKVETGVTPRGVAKPKGKEQVQRETVDAVQALAAKPAGAIGEAKSDKFGNLSYNGKPLSETGKEGTNRSTGIKVREHEVLDREGRRTGERLWIGPKNQVFPD